MKWTWLRKRNGWVRFAITMLVSLFGLMALLLVDIRIKFIRDFARSVIEAVAEITHHCARLPGEYK